MCSSTLAPYGSVMRTGLSKLLPHSPHPHYSKVNFKNREEKVQ